MINYVQYVDALLANISCHLYNCPARNNEMYLIGYSIDNAVIE